MIKVLVTGRPGIGKTTVVMSVADRVRAQGLLVGGIICPEVRAGGRRIGFDIIDLMEGRRGILSRVCSADFTGPRVGKYCVSVSDAESVGVAAIENALRRADLVIMDEVGPMELKVPALKQAMFKALGSRKPVVAVVHVRSIDYVSKHVEGNRVIYRVDEVNRNFLPDEIFSRLKTFL